LSLTGSMVPLTCISLAFSWSGLFTLRYLTGRAGHLMLMPPVSLMRISWTLAEATRPWICASVSHST